MKKTLKPLLILSISILLLSVAAFAATSGTCGDNLTWTLDDSGTLTISGTGDMYNYDDGEAPWYSLRNDITYVVIGDGVTSIGDWAFYYCTSLTSVTIPDGVTSIGNSAFSDCDSLTSVTIGDGVTTIGGEAFFDCESLESIEIPDSVTSIGDYAFNNCGRLTSVAIGDGVTSIGDMAFESCLNLTVFGVDEGNMHYSSLDGVLFNKEKTELIQYPAGKINDLYTIPSSVTSIGGYAFSYCHSLTSVTIPDSVTSIGDWAFFDCESLESIEIPSSVTSIRNSAFSHCESLESIEIPDSVTSIGYSAFEGCTSLTSVEIGESVTSIGYWAFGRCESLTDVYYRGSEADRENISIGEYNTPLIYATWHYNYGKAPTIPDDNNENDPAKIAEALQDRLPSGINDGIEVNGSGKAYAYFVLHDASGNVFANKSVKYRFDGSNAAPKTAKTNGNGIVAVETGTLTVSGKAEETRTLTVVFEGATLLQDTFTFDVTLTPAEYSQKWQGSVSAGAEVGEKLGGVLGISVGIESGNTLVLEEIIKSDGRDLKLSRAEDFSAEASASLGLGSKHLKIASAKAGISMEGRLDNGFYIEDYDPKNPEHMLNTEIFLLDTFLSLDSSNVIPKLLFEYWVEKNGLPATNERGKRFGIYGEAGATAAKLDFGGNTINVDFGGISTNQKLSWSQTNDHEGNTVTSTALQHGNSGHLLGMGYKHSADGSKTSISTGGAWLAGNWNTTDISFTAVSPSDDMRDLQSISMNTLIDSTNLSGAGMTSEINYTKEVSYAGEAAKQVADKTDYMREVGYGGFVFLIPSRAKEMTSYVTTANERGTVSVEKEKAKSFDYNLKIGLEDQLEIGMGISGSHKSAYDQETGIIKNGVEYIQSKSNLDSYIEDNANSFGKIIKDATDGIKEIFNEAIDQATAPIREGLKKAKATIKNAAKNTWNGAVYIFTFGTVNNFQKSYSIMTMSVEEGPVSVSTTVGEPYVIAVEDESGNVITDFGDNVLEFSLAFDEEDFAVSEIDYSDEMIALLKIYRWDEKLGVYLAEECELDRENNCVNATISKPGQYILAVDNAAPSVDNFNVSRTDATPTISAIVTDMSGIGEFSFAIDGEEKVNAESFYEYYDMATGAFTYEVKKPLTQGEHTASIFAADSSGNAMAEPLVLTFVVDDTAPVITSVAVPEFTAEEKLTVTATATDNNLSALTAEVDYAGMKVSTAMKEENGVWTADLDGLPKFARVDVRVYAYDSAGNCSVSEAKPSIIARKAKEDVYLGILDYTELSTDVLINNTTNETVSASLILNGYNADGELAEAITQDVTLNPGYSIVTVKPQNYHYKVRAELEDTDGNNICTGFSAFSNAIGTDWVSVGVVTETSAQLKLENSQAGKCIVAIYEESGKMLTCGSLDVSANAGDVTVTFDEFSCDGGYIVKVFMTDSNYAPICKNVIRGR